MEPGGERSDSDALFGLILEVVPGGVVRFDGRGVILDANPEALDFLGVRLEELAGLTAADFRDATVNEDGSPCPVEAYPVSKALASGRATGPQTLGVRRRDGGLRWAVFRAVPLRDGAVISFIDITQRKLAEEEMRRSEARWRAIAENIPDFVVILDPKGIILQVNRTHVHTTPANVEGRCIYDFVEAPHLAEYRRKVADALAKGETQSMTVRATGRERKYTWYETTFVPLREPDRADRLLIVARDMTERKLADDALRASEQKWRVLAENVPDFVTLVDREARILSINKVYPELREEDVLQRSLYDYLAPDTVPDYRACFERALETKAPVHFETRGYGPSGAITWYDSNVVPLVEGGEVQSLIVVSRDMTDRKRADDAIRASEQKWRALVDSLPDNVLVVDRERRILSTNNRRSSLPVDALIGASCDQFVDETMLDEWRSHFDRALETKKPVRYEGRASGRPGVLSWYESILVPLEEHGEVTRVMIVARDITERRSMLASLAEKERLASVGMVAASVAHEIMNPLTYVLANLDFALGMAKIDDARRTKSLTEAREGARRMQQIVWDLRSLGRAGAEELFYVDARSVLETALRLSGPEVGRTARVTLDLQEVPGVLASESRLCQVFINLLVNAAQAMEERPLPEREIHVRTRHDESNGLVAVEIADSGVGIARERLDRIFEPFYTTKRTGTGLGLSISRDIIERMGGRIAVDSVVGRGTTFTVWLSTTRTRTAGAAE